jgi:uncharacterized protein (DUF1810 family)
VGDPFNLDRFVTAQEAVYEQARAELNSGMKRSHWMWFIFPQLAGLGKSPTARFYGIASIDEAKAYVEHPLLGPRLRQCVETILSWAGQRDAEQIFGPIDALKLRSSMTLFDQVNPDDRFAAALVAFFENTRDELTLALLNAQA